MSIKRHLCGIATESRLSPSCLKVFGVILASSWLLSIRDIVRECGWSGGTFWAHHCIRRLRTCGLVAFEDGDRGTIRATCRVEVLE